jgi:NADH-quinone oxidoreductase subunit L
MLDYAWIIPLLPAASFVLILFFGKRMPKGGSEIGIAAVGLAFLLAVATNINWFGHVDDAGPEPVTKGFTWFQLGGQKIDVGMLLDGPAVMMLFVVTLVSLLVHVYSTDYVHGDRRYTHFFAFLSLFTASMLGLVMAQSTLQLIVMWELVGVCSFALIGHWWEEKANSDAALKAFLTNRVGDIGLLCGMVILFFAAGGTFDIVEINSQALSGEISQTTLLVASLALIAAVMSKSGQFILHTWLPDAMAGPTPVSALIHAATMVVAGIYMVARMYGVFFEGLNIGTSNVNALAVVGGVTVIGGALLAFVQDDIKKVLAYSTVSQLGYMVMALGVGAWSAALFHLFTHAFFKAGLFLGSGSVSHAVHSFDMKKDMGGLRKWMPQTFTTFMICTAALIGFVPLAGFWSKDEILAGAQQLGGDGGYVAFLVVGIVGAFLTAAYMTRVVYLTFYGEFRGHGTPHESGPRITVPLWILSGLAIVAGAANLPEGFALGTGLDLQFVKKYEPMYHADGGLVASVGQYFPNHDLHHFDHPDFALGIAVLATLIGLAGVGVSYLWYWRGVGLHGITERSAVARAGYKVLEYKYGFDILYTNIIVGGIKGPIARAVNWSNQKLLDGVVNGAGKSATVAGRFVYNQIDQGVVDRVVNGSGDAAGGSGQLFRKLTSGKVQQYGALLFGAAAVFAGVLVIFV